MLLQCRYPLALASIHMTAFTLDLAEKRDLQLFLLRSTQTKPDPTSALTTQPKEYSALLRISSDLLLLFHEHWKQGSFTVMRAFSFLLPRPRVDLFSPNFDAIVS